MTFKKCFQILLGLLFLISQSANAFTPDVELTFRAQSIHLALQELKQKKRMLSLEEKVDQDQVDHALQNWPADLKITSQENWIAIEHKNTAAVIEFLDGKIHLNGMVLNLNPELSITQNLKNWALRYEKTKKRSKYEWIRESLVSKANAQLDPVTMATATSIASGSMENFAMNYAIAQSMTTSASATAGVGTGSAAAAAGGSVLASTLIVGGIVIALTAVTGAVYCELQADLTTTWNSRANRARERLNCYSKPLSWIGMNPRDSLYMQNLTCDGNKITVALESQTKIRTNRTLTFQNGQLISVAEDGLAQKPYTSGKLLTESPQKLNQKSKELAESFRKEATYYQKICSDPQAKQKLLLKIAEQEEKGKIYTEQPKAPSSPSTK